MTNEQNYLSVLRESIVKQYEKHPTSCGGSFGEILCWEIHSNEMSFIWLATKWGISLPTLGDLIKDHCDRLQKMPKVDFKSTRDEIIERTFNESKE